MQSLEHILDAPILVLFLVSGSDYLIALVIPILCVDIFFECFVAEVSWYLCLGIDCQSDHLYVDVSGSQCRFSTNCSGLEVLSWYDGTLVYQCFLCRYFSTRSVAIILDVLILSFSWTILVVTLLHIRGWFPFKVKVSFLVRYGTSKNYCFVFLEIS